MKKLISLVFILSLNLFSATLEQAQHRLPPVIYSLDIPKYVMPDVYTDFKWTVMGYHDTYDIIINVYDENGNKIATDKVSPYKETKGQYHYENIQSKRFWYKTSLSLLFYSNQDLIIRFFASPPNDNIDTNFLSCLVPGGLGYEAADTTGRKIKIHGVMQQNQNNVSLLINAIEKQIKNDNDTHGGECKLYLQTIFKNNAIEYKINNHKVTMPTNKSNIKWLGKGWNDTESFIEIGSYSAGSNTNVNEENIKALLKKAKKGDFIQLFWNPSSSKNRLTPHTIYVLKDFNENQNLNWGDSNLNGQKKVRYGTKYPWGSDKTFDSLVKYLSIEKYCKNKCGATIYRINPNISNN